MTINTVGVTLVCCFDCTEECPSRPMSEELFHRSCNAPRMKLVRGDFFFGGGLPRLRNRVHLRVQSMEFGIFSPEKWWRYYLADKVRIQHPYDFIQDREWFSPVGEIV